MMKLFGKVVRALAKVTFASKMTLKMNKSWSFPHGDKSLIEVVDTEWCIAFFVDYY